MRHPACLRYGNPAIWVTENGVSVPGEQRMSKADALKDDWRIAYFHGYLGGVCAAARWVS